VKLKRKKRGSEGKLEMKKKKLIYEILLLMYLSKLDLDDS
jgi:hypothetical protein